MRQNLDINIAKKTPISAKVIMGLAKRNRRAKPLHIDHTIQRIRRPLLHRHRHGSVDKGQRIDPRVDVLELPDPPDPVQRRVMEVEDRVAGGSVGIAARIDRGDVVACCVDLIPGQLGSPLRVTGHKEVEGWRLTPQGYGSFLGTGEPSNVL